MRVVTYSQGLRIDEPTLVATLAIFCEKTWLPYERVGDTMQKVLEEAEALPDAVAALREDTVRQDVRQWDAALDDLFKEQIFERLPGPSATNHAAHRHEFDGQSIREIVGAPKSIYERLALRFHFTRGDLPGIEMFELENGKWRDRSCPERDLSKPAQAAANRAEANPRPARRRASPRAQRILGDDRARVCHLHRSDRGAGPYRQKRIGRSNGRPRIMTAPRRCAPFQTIRPALLAVAWTTIGSSSPRSSHAPASITAA